MINSYSKKQNKKKKQKKKTKQKTNKKSIEALTEADRITVIVYCVSWFQRKYNYDIVLKVTHLLKSRRTTHMMMNIKHIPTRTPIIVGSTKVPNPSGSLVPT